MKLQEIAEALGCRLAGDPDLEIRGVAGIDEAEAGQLTFLSNPRYAQSARATRASALLTDSPIDGLDLAFLISPDPYLDFARALELFEPPDQRDPGIHPTAVIAPTASVGSGASIGPYTVIEADARIGENAVLYPHVVIERGARIGADFEARSGVAVGHGTWIGDRVTLHHHATVGSDGFGFARRPDGSHQKIPQLGRVVIEDDVVVQAGSCIDRAAVGETRIGRGSIIDNLVQIGHGVKVGANTILCAQVGIAGSTSLGANCILAGQAGVINHLELGAGVLVTAQAGVGHDLADGAKVSGSPAFDNRRWLRSTAAFHRLPDLERDLRKLRKRVGKLDGED